MNETDIKFCKFSVFQNVEKKGFQT